MESFGGIPSGYNTSGLLVELHWNGTSRTAIGCAIAAAWHETTVQSKRVSSYGAWSIAPSSGDNKDQNDFPENVKTNKPVTLDPSWLNLVTPSVPASDLGPANDTVNSLERMLTDTRFSLLGQEVRTVANICSSLPVDQSYTDVEILNNHKCSFLGMTFLQQVVAMMVADGLSRYGSHLAMNLSDDLDLWVPKTPELYNASGPFRLSDMSKSPSGASGGNWMHMYVFGYSYYPHAKSDHLMLAPAGAYLLLAISYIIYTIFWRGSHGTSNAWDTVAELLVLCQNSPPPNPSHKLGNASSGIEHLKTYQSVVKVRAFPPEDIDGAPKLRLVLEDDAVSVHQGTVSKTGSHSTSTASLNPKPDQSGLENIPLTTVQIAQVSSPTTTH